MAYERHVAIKVRASDILNAPYVKGEGMNPNYISLNENKVYRFNLMGVIVDVDNTPKVASLLVDDGSAKLSIRSFENTEEFGLLNVGEVVLVIGKPREYNAERYVLAEIVKKIDPLWAKVRSLELGPQREQAPETKNENLSVEVESVESEAAASSPLNETNKLLSLIKELDTGDGVSVEALLPRGIENLDAKIATMLQEGDVFEIKPGKLKVLE